MRNLTNATKFQATKRAIVDLLQACGPCEMSLIVSEVKVQAYPAFLPKALSELMQSLTVRYDSKEQSYEMR